MQRLILVVSIIALAGSSADTKGKGLAHDFLPAVRRHESRGSRTRRALSGSLRARRQRCLQISVVPRVPKTPVRRWK